MKHRAIAIAYLLSSPILLAQEAAEKAADGGGTSFGQIMDAGGWPMYVLLALSAIGLFLVILFILTFRFRILCPKAFFMEAQEAAEDGDIEALRAACAGNSSAAARIMTAGAEQIAIAHSLEYMAVRDAVQDEGARQANALWQRLQFLMDVAVIAPMVGLLGTVLGMLKSFAGMKTELGAVRPATLSQGVAQALITTAAGLIVGILAMILYAVFRGWVNQLLARLEETCSLLLRKFIENFNPSGKGD